MASIQSSLDAWAGSLTALINGIEIDAEGVDLVPLLKNVKIDDQEVNLAASETQKGHSG